MNMMVKAQHSRRAAYIRRVDDSFRAIMETLDALNTIIRDNWDLQQKMLKPTSRDIGAGIDTTNDNRQGRAAQFI